MIYDNEQRLEARPAEVAAESHQQWDSYAQNLAAAHKLRGGERVRPAASATTVRGNGGGQPLLSDGPYAETKEQLGGFFVVEARDLDEAVALAAKMPHLAD